MLQDLVDVIYYPDDWIQHSLSMSTAQLMIFAILENEGIDQSQSTTSQTTQ